MTCTVFPSRAHDYFFETLLPEEVLRLEEHLEACEACAAFARLCREISCREVADFLDDYAAGLLSAERGAVFERHLALCTDCRRYLDSYRATLALGREALSGASQPPSTLPPQLLEAILAARRASGG